MIDLILTILAAVYLAIVSLAGWVWTTERRSPPAGAKLALLLVLSAGVGAVWAVVFLVGHALA